MGQHSNAIGSALIRYWDSTVVTMGHNNHNIGDLQQHFPNKQKGGHNQGLHTPFLMPKSDLGGILTHDLQNRNLTLYTAKLRGHVDSEKIVKKR